MADIQRAVYRAQADPTKMDAAAAALTGVCHDLPLGPAAGQMLALGLFRWRNHFFTYWEGIGAAPLPEAIFREAPALLQPWPGAEAPRYFVPMMDIFHCLAPTDVAGWRRQSPIQRLQVRVARLQPHRVSSYIFYHYQLQEERPAGFDKYCLISLHENLILFYQELPAVMERPAPAGKLSTANTPEDWHGTMFPHFHLWEDAPPGQEIWREIQVLVHRYLEPER